ncbi:MAG TPA: hypothetical protein VGW40_07740 [Allosphingosinicella sp.]|nr:hypothetical protein [Allosphingosinicella sp.]
MLLRRRIEHYLRRTQTSPTRFGRDVVNDPNLIFELRSGRRLGKRISKKIRAWLDRERRRR